MVNIPEKINMFNVYQDGNKLIGISEEVTLPDFESLTETISGPGILGEIDSPTVGHFGSMEMEIPYRTIDCATDLVTTSGVVDITLRASEQSTTGTGEVKFKSMRVTVRGKIKKFSAGSLKQGSAMGSSVTIEVLYILIFVDGKTAIELDKLNCIYKVNGIDLLEEVRNQC